MARDKLKLCLVTPSLGMGGMERVLSLLANYSDESGFDVKIFCLIKKEVAYPLNSGVSVFGPDRPYSGGWLAKIKVLFNLIKFLRKEAPDAVLAFSEVFNPLSIVASRISRRRVFISDRSSPTVNLPLHIRFARRLLYPFASGVVCQTEFSKREAFRKSFNSNLVVIPNPLRRIDESLPKCAGKIVVSMGRLVPSKNFFELIEMFLAADKAREWTLMIMGEGPERQALEEYVNSLGSSDRVRFLGAIDNVDYYFSQASVFAYASVSEGFPNALSEALAFPLATIAYDCPAGPNEMISDGVNGILVPLNDKELFVRKFRCLLQDDALRSELTMGYGEYRKRFSADLVCKKYLDFIFS